MVRATSGHVGGRGAAHQPADEPGHAPPTSSAAAPTRPASQIAVRRTWSAVAPSSCVTSRLPAALGGADQDRVHDRDAGVQPGRAEQHPETELVRGPGPRRRPARSIAAEHRRAPRGSRDRRPAAATARRAPGITKTGPARRSRRCRATRARGRAGRRTGPARPRRPRPRAGRTSLPSTRARTGRRALPVSKVQVSVTATARPCRSSRLPRTARRPRAAAAAATSTASTSSRSPRTAAAPDGGRRPPATAGSRGQGLDHARRLRSRRPEEPASCARSRAVVQSAVKLSARISDPAIDEIATIGAASAAGVRDAVRTWSRASRADTSRSTKGRASRPASHGEERPHRSTSARPRHLRQQDGGDQREQRLHAGGEGQQRRRRPPSSTRADERLPDAGPTTLHGGLPERRDRCDAGGPLGGPPAAEQRDHRHRTGRRPAQASHGGAAPAASRSVTPRDLSSAENAGAERPSRAGSPPPWRARATTADSPSTIRRTCRGVAPTSRSRPSSRRRAATTKPKVLATTNIAMNSATADMIPNIAARSSSWATSWSAVTPGWLRRRDRSRR